MKSEWRPTDSPPSSLTDMRDKRCIALTLILFTLLKAITSETTKELARPKAATFVLALNRVNIVAVTTILVSYVGVIGHQVLRHEVFMFPRRSCIASFARKGGPGKPCPPLGGCSWVLRTPREARDLGNRQAPQQSVRLEVFLPSSVLW